VTTVARWIRTKILSRVDKSYCGDDGGFDKRTSVNVQDYAVNAIREWGEVFCGFGVYSVQEVFFRAGLFYRYLPVFWVLSLIECSGLSPFLTTFEVFTVPSRVGRLLLAMRQFAKFDIDNLWYGSGFMINPGFLNLSGEWLGII